MVLGRNCIHGRVHGLIVANVKRFGIIWVIVMCAVSISPKISHPKPYELYGEVITDKFFQNIATIAPKRSITISRGQSVFDVVLGPCLDSLPNNYERQVYSSQRVFFDDLASQIRDKRGLPEDSEIGLNDLLSTKLDTDYRLTVPHCGTTFLRDQFIEVRKVQWPNGAGIDHFYYHVPSPNQFDKNNEPIAVDEIYKQTHYDPHPPFSGKDLVAYRNFFLSINGSLQGQPQANKSYYVPIFKPIDLPEAAASLLGLIEETAENAASVQADLVSELFQHHDENVSDMCRTNVSAPYNIDDLLYLLNINERLTEKVDVRADGQAILVFDGQVPNHDLMPFNESIVFTGFVVDQRRPRREQTVNQHGAHVAAVAMGGPDFIHFRSAFLKRLFEVGFVGYDRTQRFKDALAIAGEVEKYNKIDVVNISLGYRTSTAAPKGSAKAFDQFRAHLGSDSQTLFVVASGNDGEQIEETALYPAGYGKEDNVITVAALRPLTKKEKDELGLGAGDYALADFSNRNKPERQYPVFIGALGCGISTLEFDQDLNRYVRTRVNGTSFAAPQVTFATALIKYFDHSLKPRDLKKRIDASADRFKVLEDGISQGRVLNIVKAVAIYTDVVEDRQGRLWFGRASLKGREISNGKLTVCGDLDAKFDVSKIRKIIVRTKERLVVYDDAGRINAMAVACEYPLPYDIELDMVFADSRQKVFRSNQIRDITFAIKVLPEGYPEQ